MQEKLKKINPTYLLGYILIPLVICLISILIGNLAFHDGGSGAVICFMVIPIIAIVWWIFGGGLVFKKQTRELEQKFASEGYKRNHTFYGRGKTVVLDIEKGVMGIVFYWNPGNFYIIPASRVQKAWTDDGKIGSGFMEGSSRVSFLFTVDDVKVRVDTFTSNQRFRMDDKHILTAISKADMMVKSIEEAKANSKATSKSSKSEKSETSSKKSTDTKSSSAKADSSSKSNDHESK